MHKSRILLLTSFFLSTTMQSSEIIPVALDGERVVREGIIPAALGTALVFTPFAALTGQKSFTPTIHTHTPLAIIFEKWGPDLVGSRVDKTLMGLGIASLLLTALNCTNPASPEKAQELTEHLITMNQVLLPPATIIALHKLFYRLHHSENRLAEGAAHFAARAASFVLGVAAAKNKIGTKGAVPMLTYHLGRLDNHVTGGQVQRFVNRILYGTSS